MDITLRKATLKDARFLYDLRNDPSVRKVSFNTGEIVFESHAQWLAKKLQDPRTELYVAEAAGRPVAQLRFDVVSAEEAEINIAVAESYRGKGYGSLVISRGSRLLFQNRPTIMRIRARIKSDNLSSLRSFDKAGYTKKRTSLLKNSQIAEMTLFRTNPEMRVGGRLIGAGNPCFVVAELSGNHHQNYDEAVALVRAAKEAGADAVKLQTYTADTITLQSAKEWFRVGGKDNPEKWKGKTLYELYTEAFTPWEWQPKLKKLADELGITLFSSPFDETAVDFLEKMRVPCYKIASYEMTDFLLLRKVARAGKPVIMSVGYASLQEIEFALTTLRENGAKDIALLHCVTGYSAKPKVADMHLSNIKDMQTRFGVVGGFSDNNAGIEIPLMAVVAGASIIEKHIILDRRKGGPDAQFSLEPAEFKELVQHIRKVESGGMKPAVAQKSFGKPHYGPASALEEYNRRWRRSLFAGKDIKRGELFTRENVRDVRPAFGLETKYYDEVVGKRATKDIDFATPLSWDMIS